MIEEVVLNHLRTELSVSVCAEIPANPPESFVLVEKTGSSVSDCIETALIAVQSYAATLAEAAELCETVNEKMLLINENANVMSCTISSAGYNFTDPQTKRYRYQSLYELKY